MAGANVLSDEALQQVEEVVRRVTGGLYGGQPLPTPPIAPGPEMFLAKSPSGGIAARETNVSTSEEEVTGELCELYEAEYSDSTRVLSPMTLSDGTTAVTRTVYNFSSEAVAGDAWILIARDKFGTWWVIAEEC